MPVLLPQVTYKNLEAWYEELQQYAKGVPVIVVANKIDVNYEVGGCGGWAGGCVLVRRWCLLQAAGRLVPAAACSTAAALNPALFWLGSDVDDG